MVLPSLLPHIIIVIYFFIVRSFLSIKLTVAGHLLCFLREIFTVPFMSSDHGHNFTGACPDGSQTDIAVDALNWKNIGIGNAAHYLHGIMDDLLT